MRSLPPIMWRSRQLLVLLCLCSSAASAEDKRISSYGPISVGHPSAGFLLNAERMPTARDWVLTAPAHAYGTHETIEQLSHCLTRVRAELPGAPPVMLGSLSAKTGGKIAPHDSHRTGRDADVYFFRQAGTKWHEAATPADIDLERTWALLKCFVTDADVDFVLLDVKVQGWLEAYASSLGEPKAWLENLFHDAPGTRTLANRALVRHAPGHVAHMHVRFVSPKARKLGAALYERLVREGHIKPPYAAIHHRVVSGDTLGSIARRHRTTVAALQKQNGLRSTQIRIGQRLIVRRPVALRGAKEAVQIPARRRPPAS